MKYIQFADLLGKTFISAERGNYEHGDALIFKTADGRTFVQYHTQDCCESVWLEDVNGDLSDLVGTPILRADESSDCKEGVGYEDGGTWSFYKLATIKGYVDIRWFGTSNGYYSETVNLYEVFDLG